MCTFAVSRGVWEQVSESQVLYSSTCEAKANQKTRAASDTQRPLNVYIFGQRAVFVYIHTGHTKGRTVCRVMCDGSMNSNVVEQSGQTDSVCVDIVGEVARLSGTSPLELAPLASVVDTDALAALMKSPARDGKVVITFTYEGFRISADNTGTFEIIDQCPSANDGLGPSAARPNSSLSDSRTLE